MTKWKKTLPPNPITNGVEKADEAAWRTAMQPVDRRVSEAEKKWGCLERLIEFTNPEIAARFGSAWHRLNAAIIDGSVSEVTDRAVVAIRGIDALEKAAIENGHEPSPDVWGIAVDGVEYLICHRTIDARAVTKEAEGIQVWSLEELIRVAVSSQAGAYAQVAKHLFPAAVVKDVRETEFTKGATYNDELPF